MNNKQQYIFYLKNGNRIVLTDYNTKFDKNKEFIETVSKCLTAHKICKFDTGKDILLIKPNDINAIQITLMNDTVPDKKDNNIKKIIDEVVEEINSDSFFYMNKDDTDNRLHTIKLLEDNDIDDFKEEEKNIPKIDFPQLFNENEINEIKELDIYTELNDSSSSLLETKLTDEVYVDKRVDNDSDNGSDVDVEIVDGKENE